MFLTASSPASRRVAVIAVTTLVAALTLAGCGSTAPASNPAPSTSAVTAPPVTAPPSVAPTLAPTVVPSVAPSVAVTGAPPTGDPAAGLKIEAPYGMIALPSSLQTTFEQQMATGLGALGSSIKVGFRQVTGGSGFSILMVIAFPTGSLTAASYQAALAGMAPSMGATFTTTTVGGVEISKGAMSSGAVAIFHVGDHMLMVIGQTEADSVAVATSLINANN